MTETYKIITGIYNTEASPVLTQLCSVLASCGN